MPEPQWFIPEGTPVKEFIDINAEVFATGTTVSVFTRDDDYFSRQGELRAVHQFLESSELVDSTVPLRDWHFAFLAWASAAVTVSLYTTAQLVAPLFFAGACRPVLLTTRTLLYATRIVFVYSCIVYSIIYITPSPGRHQRPVGNDSYQQRPHHLVGAMWPSPHHSIVTRMNNNTPTKTRHLDDLRADRHWACSGLLGTHCTYLPRVDG